MSAMASAKAPAPAAKPKLWQRAQGLARVVAESDRWDKIRVAESMSVRASLRFAFASVLAGALVIGVFSLFQMGRLNGSTQAIYEQEYTAGLATEQARGLLLRASRAQKQLLTASTAEERVTLGQRCRSQHDRDCPAHGDRAEAGQHARLASPSQATVGRYGGLVQAHARLCGAGEGPAFGADGNELASAAGRCRPAQRHPQAGKNCGCLGATAQRFGPGHDCVGRTDLQNLVDLGGGDHAGAGGVCAGHQWLGHAAPGAPAGWRACLCQIHCQPHCQRRVVDAHCAQTQRPGKPAVFPARDANPAGPNHQRDCGQFQAGGQCLA